MVLCRDETAMGGGVYARLVVTTVTVSVWWREGKEGRRMERREGRERGK